MSDLKEKCLNLGLAIYEIVAHFQNNQIVQTMDEISIEAPATAGKRGRPKGSTKVASPESFNETAPLKYSVDETPSVLSVSAPIIETSTDISVEKPMDVSIETDDLFDIVPKKTPNEVKQMLREWAEKDFEKRKTFALPLFTKITGFDTFKGLTEDNSGDAFRKLQDNLDASYLAMKG